MNIERDRIRKYHDDGQLRQAGFRWDEPIEWRQRFVVGMAYAFGTTAAGLAPFAMLFYRDHDPLRDIDSIDFTLLSIFWSCFFIIAVALAVLPFVNIVRWTLQQVAVSFSSTDEIWLTRSRELFQPYSPLEWFCIVPPASEIASIEMNPMKNRVGSHYRHGGEDGYLAYCVHIQFFSGQRIRVGEYFTEDEAHIVVAQLNIARREVRAAMTSAA